MVKHIMLIKIYKREGYTYLALFPELYSFVKKPGLNNNNLNVLYALESNENISPRNNLIRWKKLAFNS